MIRGICISGVALTCVLACASCSRGPSPSKIAEQFYDDLAAGHLEAAKALATPDTAEIIDRLVQAKGAEVLKAKAGRKAAREDIHGDSATVTFENDDGSLATVPLVKLDGQWKVDFATMLQEAAKAHLPERINPQVR